MVDDHERHAAVDVYDANFHPMLATLAGRDERMFEAAK